MATLSWMADKDTTTKTTSKPEENHNQIKPAEPTVYSRTVKCFNFEKNYSQLMRKTTHSKQFGAITGIRYMNFETNITL